MEKLRRSSARQAHLQGQVVRLSGQHDLAQSVTMQHLLGEVLVQEVKAAIAEALTAKYAGDLARCRHIARRLMATWHPGMSCTMPAFPLFPSL